jgi:hypothetical protein
MHSSYIHSQRNKASTYKRIDFNAGKSSWNGSYLIRQINPDSGRGGSLDLSP